MLSSIAMFSVVSTAVWLLLAVPAAVFLLRAYNRSKMSGFLWLFGATAVWPFVARVLIALIGMIGLSVSSTSWMGNPYLLAGLAETAIGGALLAMAAWTLDHELAARMVPPVAPEAMVPVPPPPVADGRGL